MPTALPPQSHFINQPAFYYHLSSFPTSLPHFLLFASFLAFFFNFDPHSYLAPPNLSNPFFLILTSTFCSVFLFCLICLFFFNLAFLNLPASLSLRSVFHLFASFSPFLLNSVPSTPIQTVKSLAAIAPFSHENVNSPLFQDKLTACTRFPVSPLAFGIDVKASATHKKKV